MSRDARRAEAAETVEILRARRYALASGETVDLSAALDALAKAERLVTPDEAAALAGRPGGRRLEATLTWRTTLTACRAAAAADARAHVGALIFASARNPGGGFESGAQAQEESVARASALVTSQRRVGAPYYGANRAEERLVYTDHMILSPQTPVFRGDDGALFAPPAFVSFITAPAPNRSGGRISVAEAADVLRRRMRAVLALAAEIEIDALVLGAWGCGVFGNDPATVAALWRDALNDAPSADHPRRVDMAVYDASRSGVVATAFAAVFPEAAA